MGPDAMIFVLWMLSFKPGFSVSSFTFIKMLLSSSLSAIKVLSSTYLRLLTFLLEIYIPVCASFSPAFLMMYSAYKLNKQGDNIQPWLGGLCPSPKDSSLFSINKGQGGPYCSLLMETSDKSTQLSRGHMVLGGELLTSVTYNTPDMECWWYEDTRKRWFLIQKENIIKLTY